jgi:phosphatidylglycerophosphatase A
MDAQPPSRIALVVATFLGAGLSPKAPGTVGSLASLVIWAPLCLLDVSSWLRVALAIVLFIAGTLAAEHIVKRGGREDPQIVVMDEVVGMGLTLACTHTWAGVVVGTLLFRLFDIVKPWPVSLADRRIKGGFGVMFDDVLAAGYAGLALTGLEHFVFPALHL